MGRTLAREDCFKMLFEAKVAGTSADELLTFNILLDYPDT